jgi:predicted amidohydrolase
MKNTIRFGGAQLPVTPLQQKNVKAIKKAIDWAADNNVDYLVTPEASLSGYSTTYCENLEFLETALKEIEQYASSKQVGLCLGTLWAEFEEDDSKKILVKRNQIRFYTKEGQFLGAVDKHVLTPLDLEIGIVSGDGLAGALIPVDDRVIPAVGLICADLYGHMSNQGGLPQRLFNIGARIAIHSTNPERGLNEFKDQLEQQWLEANICRVSYSFFPVISVDNCYTMDGEPYTGNTITQSGVSVGGAWVVKAPRQGTQYFYYDFDIDDYFAVYEEDLPSQALVKKQYNKGVL